MTNDEKVEAMDRLVAYLDAHEAKEALTQRLAREAGLASRSDITRLRLERFAELVAAECAAMAEAAEGVDFGIRAKFGITKEKQDGMV